MQIQDYQIMEPLARGGAAQVFVARQLSADRLVALKILARLDDEDPELAARFKREARVIASLQHPNIVPILDFGVADDGHLYYSMPWLRADLGGFSRHGDEAEVARIVAALCDALSYAHQRRVVHRDIKPANVFVSGEGAIRLGDFGFALLTAAGATRLTAEGIAVGTATYMSPEQALSKAVDQRCDLYSLGVLCFEMLTGKPPFAAPNAVALAAAHVSAPIPDLPENLQAWQSFVSRAMAKQAGERFASAAEMRAALPVEVTGD